MNLRKELVKLEQLLISGQPEKCLSKLLEITKDSYKDFYKQTIYLASQFNRLEKEGNLGLIDSDAQKNKIISSTIELVFDLRSQVNHLEDLDEKELINFPAIPFSENFNAEAVFLRGRANGIFGWAANYWSREGATTGRLGFSNHPQRSERHLSLLLLFMNYTSKPISIMNFRESKLVFKDGTHLSSIVGDKKIGSTESKSWMPKIIEINQKKHGTEHQNPEVPSLGYILIKNRYRDTEMKTSSNINNLEHIEMNLTNFKGDTIYLREFISK